MVRSNLPDLEAHSGLRNEKTREFEPLSPAQYISSKSTASYGLVSSSGDADEVA